MEKIKSIILFSIKHTKFQPNKFQQEPQIKKSQKARGRLDRRTDGHNILPPRIIYPVVWGCSTAQNFGLSKWSPKRDVDDQITGKRYRETYGQKGVQEYKLDWTPLGSFGPQCGDKYITTPDPQTGNQHKKNTKVLWKIRNTYGRT